MQVALLSGIAAGPQAEFRLRYPRNLEPVPVDSKISKGQLRAAAGALPFTTGPGSDRGGILWNTQCYRAMGSRLVRVLEDGTVTDLGGIGDDGRRARFDYGFDRLMIGSAGGLYYFNGATLTQVTDQDLGTVIDALWMNGFYVTTDGTYVIVTELTGPTQVLPLKYGAAEQDPDAVTGLMKVRGELYVLGDFTIEVFELVGGNGFPFQAIPGATIPFGCVGPSAKAYYSESFAFVGGPKSDQGPRSLGVYVAGQGSAVKISSRAVDDALATVADPTAIECETRAYRDEERLFVHLPDRSFVFLREASKATGEKVWYEVGSGADTAYRPINAVQAYGKTIVGDRASSALGLLSEDVADHFGEIAEWGFDCGMLYNASGGILSEVELVGLPGRAPHGDETSVFMSMTTDGETFTTEKAKSLGQAGDRGRFVRWRMGKRFGRYIGLRFRGHGRALPGFAACEIKAEALA